MLALNSVNKGDCLEVMNNINDKSIDIILCDLPYGITTCKWDTPINLEQLWKHYKRIIKKGGAIVLTATMPFGARLIMSNPQWFRHELIWEKDNGSNPFNANVCPMRVHENILVFCEKGTIYNPQMVNGKHAYTRPHANDLKHLRPFARIPTINHGDRYPRSVLKFQKDYGKLVHSSQKPVKLFEWLIKTYSNENNLVLDNCAGSGTTAIAAMNTNRNYILIEKDEIYYDLIQERIKDNPQGAQKGSVP
jgi:site-specific DNA-methyltransferase (adenine-specific)